MSNYAQINIEHWGISALNSTINIVFTKNAVNYTRTWVCKSTRTAPYEYAIGASVPDQFSKFLAAANTDMLQDATLNPEWSVSPYNLTPYTVAFQASEWGWTSTYYFQGSAKVYGHVIPEVRFDPAAVEVFSSSIWSRINDSGADNPVDLSVMVSGSPNRVKLGDQIYAADWKIIT
jgi:hypothetical protein